MNNPCDGCQEFCYVVCKKCQGRGRVLDIVVGLGMPGLVPAYAEVLCDRCQGQGIVYRCPYYQ